MDFYNGKKYAPGSLIEEAYALEHFPLFVKAGAILPLNVASEITGFRGSAERGKELAPC